MTLSLPRMATIASDSQLLPASADIGNGHLKAVVDLAEIRHSSYILPVQKTRILDIPATSEGGLVEYLGGTRTDLIGQMWMTGSLAYSYSPTTVLRVVDSPKGKPEFGLQLFLGAMSTLQYRPQWHLSMVASTQDAQTFGESLQSALEGEHIVQFAEHGKPCTISISVQKVLEEGAGAIVNARQLIDPDAQTVLIDLGQGTTIVSQFIARGKLLQRRVIPEGVERLIDSIASSLETRQRLGQEGDRQIIRAGIENGSFEYGKTGWNFRSIYVSELKIWVSSVLSPALKIAAPWLPTASAFLAIGGGSQLPLIAELLEIKKITPVPDGHWANARGMARIAYLQLRGN
ncbi:ParM/StbA family protein [Leptolyngbya ohadii]|uniref:ParM/StbA family protein n=1 Tax=Leptolyngbya ohadii TaxID=1962290 RepID=UPI00117B0E57|nr:hypothetical protein [Leptolyngbya ohadii]